MIALAAGLLILAGIIYFSVHSAVIPLILLCAVFFLLLKIAIEYKTTEIAITNKRIIAKFGLIERKTIELNLLKVESIQVEQGVIGRLFNYGTIIISGGGNPLAPIAKISNPLMFRNRFVEATDGIQQTKNYNV
jgi:uncharacterized membrane protein YdbT with pleckstrin-like domain